jgi:large subunit ribosomal protein L30
MAEGSGAALKVTQVRSEIGTQSRHRGTLRALGLGRIGQSAVHRDSPTLQGMLRRVQFLIRVEEAQDAR